MYTTIIHPIRKALCLSLEGYVLLDTIYHLSNNVKYSGWCVATKEYLGDVCDLKRSRVYELLKELEEKELIERDDKTGFLRAKDVWNEMIANKSDWAVGFDGKESQFVSAKAVQTKLTCSEPESPENGRVVQKVDGHSPESGLQIGKPVSDGSNLQVPEPRSPETGHNNNIDNNNNNNNTPISENREDEKEKVKGCEFSDFWALYPKKMGKAKAIDSFKKLSEKDKVSAIEALPAHKAQLGWQQEGGRYIPFPATWLNQRRWEDDLTSDIAQEETIIYNGVEMTRTQFNILRKNQT